MLILLHSFYSPDYTFDNSKDFTAVESFNLQTKTWQAEPTFPFDPVAVPTNIPYGNTFLTVGGMVNRENVDYVYKVMNSTKLTCEHFSKSLFQYEPETSSWRKLPVALPTAVHFPAAFILDENEIPC